MDELDKMLNVLRGFLILIGVILIGFIGLAINLFING